LNYYNRKNNPVSIYLLFQDGMQYAIRIECVSKKNLLRISKQVDKGDNNNARREDPFPIPIQFTSSFLPEGQY
jgi:hypothetical protein